MSGMEVMGLVSAIISIIDFSNEIFTAIKNSKDLPEAFKKVAAQLPLARETLQTLGARLDGQELDDNTRKAIETLLKQCKFSADELQELMKALAAGTDAKRMERYVQAVRRRGHGKKVEDLMKHILEDIQLLAANYTILHLETGRIDELRQAIRELSAVPSSTSTVSSNYTFQHSGIGDQFNNTGPGPQNINKGSGNQNFAETITFMSS